MSSSFDKLPTDIIKLLLLYPDYLSLFKIFRISRKFSKLYNDESFWIFYTQNRKYLKTEESLGICRSFVMLNELGFYQAQELKFEDGIQTYHIGWDFDKTPRKQRAITLYNKHTRSDGNHLIARCRKRIMFQNVVILEIPYRGRYKKSDVDNADNFDDQTTRFYLTTNTPIGSTLDHVFTEIYRHMYDLTESELDQDLNDDSLGFIDMIYYDKERNVYVVTEEYH